MAQMTKIKLDEISLVDYPAHMVNGFPVIKSASTENASDIMDALGKRNTEMPLAEQVAKALAETPISELVKALESRADIEEFEKAFPFKKKPADKMTEKPAEGSAAEEAGESKEEEDAEEGLKKMLKSLPAEFSELLKSRDAQIEEFQKAAAKAEADAEIAKAAQLDGEAITKSKELTNLAFDHDVVAPALRKFAAVNPEAGAAIDIMLKAVNAQADGAIFKELGTTAPIAKSDPEIALEAVAKALVTSGAAKDMPDAFAKAVANPANKELVSSYYKAGN